MLCWPLQCVFYGRERLIGTKQIRIDSSLNMRDYLTKEQGHFMRIATVVGHFLRTKCWYFQGAPNISNYFMSWVQARGGGVVFWVEGGAELIFLCGTKLAGQARKYLLWH